MIIYMNRRVVCGIPYTGALRRTCPSGADGEIRVTDGIGVTHDRLYHLASVNANDMPLMCYNRGAEEP